MACVALLVQLQTGSAAADLVEAHMGSGSANFKYGTQSMEKVVDVYVYPDRENPYKVNSVFFYPNAIQYAEIGWSENGYNGKFEHFSAVTTHHAGQVEQHEGTPQVDVSYKYTVRLLSQSSRKWRWIVNSTTVREEVMKEMPLTGRCMLQSERDRNATNMWAHWWEAKYWDYDSWEPWYAGGEYYNNTTDGPNPYHIHKDSNTEYYCHPGAS